MSFLTRSPLRSQRLKDTVDDSSDKDLEAGEDEDSESDVFDISPKKPSIQSLKKWRQATLVLNASRRFRYTLDLKNREEDPRDVRVRRFRTSTHALRAIQRFKEAGARFKPDGPSPEGFELRPGQLALMIQEHRLDALTDLGGLEGLGKLLRTDLEKGIDDDPEELQRRKLAYGENTYPRKSPKNFLIFLWEACQDTTLIILMVCAALSLTLGMIVNGPTKGWYDGVSITFAVFLVIIVTACSDYKQSLQFRSLSEEKRNIQIQVARGGRRLKVSIYELVVGDVVPLQIGDQVPADGLLIVGYSLVIDESSMTGESELVHKDAKHPFLMAGCKVADGYGTMLITCVGTDTEWGQIMASISDDTGEETPLQVRLNGVATFIGQIGLTVAIIVFIMLFVRYFAQHFKRGSTKALTALRNVVDILSIAVTIVVVAVPEGLPLAVTLTLAYSMRKMMADKSLVRHLAACETMGSATTICSDKTGTLTLNEMTVVKAWVAGDQRKLEDTRNIKDSALSFIMDGIAHNCNASVYFPKDGGDAEVTGSPTERALLSWGLKVGLDFDVVRTKSTILHVETFNSTKKRAGVAIKVETGEVFVHWKGAAEIVLDLSEKWLDADGSEVMLTDEKILEITNTIDGMAAASLRCVALAYRCLDAHEVPFDDEQREAWRLPDTGLVFSAVVGIKDPCRPGVPEAVAICQAAGVKVRMVTGDNLMTAKAIAQECGILTAGGVVVEGKEFRNYSEEERIVKLPNIDVLARSSPSDKLLLVKTLRGMNEVVAVTGDGTNDAAALHEADIGLSMGISGTEVAKESSDIIILDDNFASVVKVVRWGRSVYANIQKFIQFQLTVNIVALVINFVAAAKSEDVPLTTVQLLWVNLLMDTLGALALATEPPTDELMKRNPVGRRQPLITNVMWRNIWGQAIYQLVILLTIYFRGDDVLRLKSDSQNRHMQKNTMVFNSFVFCQLFNEINSRKPEDFNVFGGIFHNSLFCGVLLVTSTLQVIFVVFLKKFFKTTALSWKQWLICICIGAISLPVGFLVKLIPVREKPFLSTSLKRRRRGQRSSRHRPSSRSTLKLEQSSGALHGKATENGEIAG